MSRLIDADALLDKFLRAYTEQEKIGNFMFVACEIKQNFANMIEDAPTIQYPEWISCAERLPEYNKEVLVYNSGLIRVYSLSKGNNWRSDKWEDEHGDWQSLDDVTHWMPLPQLPKEDE